MCFIVEVLVTVRHLRLTEPYRHPPPTTWPGAGVSRLLLPPPRLTRFLYSAVGDSSGWASRTNWADDQWVDELARPWVEWWLCWHRDRISGFVELRGGRPPHRSTTYIKYLGLLPEFRKRGLGANLVAQARWRASTMHTRWPDLPDVARVTVDTSEADDQRALRYYRAQGFEIVHIGAEDRPISLSVAARLQRESRINT